MGVGENNIHDDHLVDDGSVLSESSDCEDGGVLLPVGPENIDTPGLAVEPEDKSDKEKREKEMKEKRNKKPRCRFHPGTAVAKVHSNPPD